MSCILYHPTPHQLGLIHDSKEEGIVLRTQCKKKGLPYPERVCAMKVLTNYFQSQTATRVREGKGGRRRAGWRSERRGGGWEGSEREEGRMEGREGGREEGREEGKEEGMEGEGKEEGITVEDEVHVIEIQHQM